MSSTVVTWIIISVVVVFVLWIIMIYNGLVALRQRVNQRSPTSTCRPSSATTSFPTWSRR